MSTVKLNDALKKAVYVSDEIELKSAVARNELIIISNDLKLYSKLLQKFPKEKITKKANKLGKVIAGLGIGITVATAGLFSFIGLPIAAAGTALGVGGNVLDEYNKYSICMDYKNKKVMFVKIKGNPCIDTDELKGKLC